MSKSEINIVFLECNNLGIGYLSKGIVKPIMEGINLKLYSGQLTALMGANGSGKTTLLRTLSSLQNAISGNIFLNGEDITKEDISKNIAIVLTSPIYAPNFTVFDLISTGRIPFTNWLGKLESRDIDIINKSIDAVGIAELTNRLVSQLSDGEKQKVMIAKALAQESPIIILDEPTAHLDLVNRVEISKLLRQLAHRENKAILLATHELDLAIQTADRIWLMESNNIHVGAPEDMIINNELQNAFAKMSIDFDQLSGTFRIKPQVLIPIYFEKISNSSMELWTERLLLKFGFYISGDKSEQIQLIFDTNKSCWVLKNMSVEKEFYKLASLGDELRNIVSQIEIK